ncbi:ATP-grasp domain-containing protein [Nocardia bovistercoris]|uniref:ATP-grasp domain-containing protein n=1 Tax=Nocardia bovistercoris TaxID=2785916 RepID=A0A931I6L2_9NOCA|nr:hypothetical protein [Nocardia bovistercoris]MBH0774825.1 hypothetical protein [Nocardia bovistercoris]
MAARLPGSVLIVTESDDPHVAAMTATLRADHAVTAIHLDLRDFPRERGSFRLHRFGTARTVSHLAGLDGVRSVWWRVPASGHRGRGAECDSFLEGLLWSIPAVWINDPAADSFAARAIVQLETAQRAGCAVPETLITNDADDARDFVESRPGPVVYRSGTAADFAGPTSADFAGSGTSADFADRVTPADFADRVTPADFADRVTPADFAGSVTPADFAGSGTASDFAGSTIAGGFADPDRLTVSESAPIALQDHIPPRCDLRVVWVDGIEWTVRLDPPNSYRPDKLPASVSKSLSTLMGALGLSFGVLSLRLGLDGEYYFREVDPRGHFAHLERETGLPLSRSVGNLLVRGDGTVAGDQLTGSGWPP